MWQFSKFLRHLRRACLQQVSFASEVSSRVWRGYLCDALHVVVEAKSYVGTMLGSIVMQALARVVVTEGQGFSQEVHLREAAQISQKRFQSPAKSRNILATAAELKVTQDVWEILVIGMPEVLIHKGRRVRSIQQPYSTLAILVTSSSAHELHSLLQCVLQLV